MSQQFNFLSQ